MRQLYSCFLTGIVALLFLAGCSDTPPSIQLDQPEGQVIDLSDYGTTDTNTVQTITGRAVRGTNSILDLKVGNTTVPVDATDGSFSYDFTLTDPASNLFSTCTFIIRDNKFISNQERIVFINGASSENIGEAAFGDTLNDAVNVMLNEDMLDTVVSAAERVINENLQEIINDVIGDAPIVAVDGPGTMEVEILDVSIGDLSFGNIDIQDGNWLAANNLFIGEIYVGGRVRVFKLGSWEVWIPFSANIQDIDITTIDVTVFKNESTNNISMRVDMDDLDNNFWRSLSVSLNFGGLVIPSGFTDLFLPLVGSFFRLLFDTLSIALMDADDLAMTFDTGSMTMYGIPMELALDIGAWFDWYPDGYDPSGELPIFWTNLRGSGVGEMFLQLGLSVEPAAPVLNPIGHYFSTPNDPLPEPDVLIFDDTNFTDNNLIVSINDDMINMGAQAAVDAGLLDGLDVTSAFKHLAGDVFANSLFSNTRVLVYMKTPPIADFSCPSGQDCSYTYTESNDVTNCYAGKFIVRDMVIIIDNLLAGNIIDTVRVSADTDVGINLTLVNGGTRIEGSMAGSSRLDIAYLYVQNANLTALANIAPEIVNYVMGIVLKALIKIDVPVVDMYDANVQPHIYATQVGENNMITWLGVSDIEVTAP